MRSRWSDSSAGVTLVVIGALLLVAGGGDVDERAGSRPADDRPGLRRLHRGRRAGPDQPARGPGRRAAGRGRRPRRTPCWRASADVPTQYDAMQVVAVVAVAMLVGTVPHVAVGQPPRLEAMARRILDDGLRRGDLPPALHLRRARRARDPWTGSCQPFMLVVVACRRFRRRAARRVDPQRPRARCPSSPALRDEGARLRRDRLGHRRHRRPDRPGRRGHGLLGAARSSRSRC